MWSTIGEIHSPSKCSHLQNFSKDSKDFLKELKISFSAPGFF
jgi:hypothetical protein